jgi:L-rhamnose-H+ transport protein
MTAIWGTVLVLLAGIMQAGFPLPMKYTRVWDWEHIWLVSSLLGLVIFPWMIAAWTIPAIVPVLAHCPAGALAVVFFFGAGWGIGGLLFGLGVHRIGLSLTLGIVVGLTSALGSVLPMALFHPERLADKIAYLVFGSVAITLLGLVFCTIAGIHRERRMKTTAARAFRRGSYRAGVLICLLSGALSPLFNFALICGEPLMRMARQYGASELYAPNLIWAVAMTGGMLPTLFYCGADLRRKGSWSRFHRPGQLREWVLAGAMGILFAFGNAAYGIGAERLGSMGPILGWPAFMAMQVVSGNALGLITGEWRGAGAQALRYLALGNVALVIAIFMIAPASS